MHDEPAAAGVQPATAPLPPTEGAPGEPPPVVIQSPVGIRAMTLSVLATIAAILMLQYAQGVLIPIVLGLLIAYSLEPVVRGIARAKVPRSIGAAVVLLVLLAGLGMATYSLAGEAMQVLSELPQAAQRIRARVQAHGRKPGGAIQKVQKAATELEKTAQVASAQAEPQTKPSEPVTKVEVVQPTVNVTSYLYSGGMGLAALAGQATVVLFLVYFFLATGDLYKRKIVKIAGPRLWQKKLTVQILDDINRQIASFMLVQVVTSALVGAATMAALWYLGLHQWIIWGLLAGIFNSIPYLGPVIVTGGLGLVAFLQFDDIQRTLIACGAAFVITSLEGFLLTPALMGRAARMNPVAVFVGLLFWSWIWGVWGAVLAVPMLMMLKAVCDHIEDLQPIAELLGE
jgi:predicted PurR-regulated permease PerM